MCHRMSSLWLPSISIIFTTRAIVRWAPLQSDQPKREEPNGLQPSLYLTVTTYSAMAHANECDAHHLKMKANNNPMLPRTVQLNFGRGISSPTATPGGWEHCRDSACHAPKPPQSGRTSPHLPVASHSKRHDHSCPLPYRRCKKIATQENGISTFGTTVQSFVFSSAAVAICTCFG